MLPWEAVLTEAQQRGRELVDELDHLAEELHLHLPDMSFRIEDRYGVVVRQRLLEGETGAPPSAWPAFPIAVHQRLFGILRTSRPMAPERESKISDLLLPLALNLTELMEWAETEAQRRGEKIQRLLQAGLTPEVESLLALCGLREKGPYVLADMEVKGKGAPFQHMDIMRRFMLARIWQYRGPFDFLAYRPNGLVGIFPGDNVAEWSKRSEQWHEEWKRFHGDLRLLVVVTSAPTLEELPVILKEAELLLRFASRGHLQGLVPPLFHRRMNRVLAQLSPEALHTLAKDTLGPLLFPEHRHLLETLRMYLFFGQGAARAAKALYIHRNTLLYRIRHIEQLLGVQLKRIEDVSAVWTALQAVDLLEMIE